MWGALKRFVAQGDAGAVEPTRQTDVDPDVIIQKNVDPYPTFENNANLYNSLQNIEDPDLVVVENMDGSDA